MSPFLHTLQSGPFSPCTLKNTGRAFSSPATWSSVLTLDTVGMTARQVPVSSPQFCLPKASLIPQPSVSTSAGHGTGFSNPARPTVNPDLPPKPAPQPSSLSQAWQPRGPGAHTHQRHPQLFSFSHEPRLSLRTLWALPFQFARRPLLTSSVAIAANWFTYFPLSPCNLLSA